MIGTRSFQLKVAASALMIALCVAAQTAPTVVDVANATVPIQIMAKSPADTATDLQVICLFRSEPGNTLHGSLIEINDKLKGLLDRVRKPELFAGELGETLLIAPPNAPHNSGLAAKKLLVIGLEDSAIFSPGRMQLVGEVLYRESSNLGVAHPFFAPTVLDGGVAKFTTGQVAEQVIRGFLRAAQTDKLLRDAGAWGGSRVTALTYLAGAKNMDSTREGIERAITASAGK
jgi:hypothetical protein